MSNYIISPSVFYWMNVLAGMQTVFMAIGILFAITGVILMIIWFLDVFESYRPDEEDIKKTKKMRKWMIICYALAMVFIVAGMFIPTKDASIEMLVARTATFENVDWTVQQVKEVIDYIIKALKEVV